MKISIIIPCLNEEGYIEKTLDHVLGLPGNHEVIVVDGGSRDRTREIAAAFTGVKVKLSEKGRAKQMNHGAEMATGEILLFLHADTFLPQQYYSSVLRHLQKPRNVGGSFMLQLDKEHPVLKFYTWCSRLSWEFFTYGDNALFIKKSTFQDIGGYREIPFMEDVEIQKRLRKIGKFSKLGCAVTTSARRFEKVGVIRQLFIDVLLVSFYKLGASPARLKKFYKDQT